MIIRPGYCGHPVELPDEAVVVDVGSGNNPLRGATFFVERDIGISDHRGGRESVTGMGGLIIADVVSDGIPLPDKFADFVNASHVLEHVDDPVAFCMELSRVGDAGYIECPNPFIEIIHGRDVHQWLVFEDRHGGIIVCKKPDFCISPENRHAIHATEILEYNLVFPTVHFWKSYIRCTVTDDLSYAISHARYRQMVFPRVPSGTRAASIIESVFGKDTHLIWRPNR